MTPENQGDEDLKRYDSKYGHFIKWDDFIAQRQSWEREKAALEDKLSHALYQSESWMKSNAGQCARADKAEAEKKGLETQLSAWFSTFGTNQLSHAIDRLESAEKEKAGLEYLVEHEKRRADNIHGRTIAELEEKVRELTTENGQLKAQTGRH